MTIVDMPVELREKIVNFAFFGKTLPSARPRKTRASWARARARARARTRARTRTRTRARPIGHTSENESFRQTLDNEKCTRSVLR